MTQTTPKPTFENTTNGRSLSAKSFSGGNRISVTDSPTPSRRSSPPRQKRQASILQSFYNLPISRKQLIALVSSEILSVILLIGGARLIIETGLRAQLVNQSKSELAVTDINYNIKVNQMGFGFRGQSDNTAIITAAKVHAQGESLSPELKSQVQQILKNEVKSRKIEYATLVGKDLRIIVNANANRQGEIFNPDNLVQAVFSDPRQIKASAIVSWAELSKESPPLPKGFANQNALIRYTVTPVRDPATQEIIGALVSGDIVNGKDPIVKGTIKAFGGGYSAVYLRQSDGQYTLATALDQAQPNVPLPNSLLLTEATDAQGQAVTKRMAVREQTYTLAAKTLPNLLREEVSGSVPVPTEQPPVAILVRGTPETALNELLNQSLLQELAMLLVAVALIGSWAILLRRAIVEPIEELQRTTQQFSHGDLNARAEIFAEDEVGQLGENFNEMADNIQASLNAQIQDAKQVKLLADITSSLVLSKEDLDKVFNKGLAKARQTLKVDRLVIYRFNPDWSGYISHESVAPEWPRALNAPIEDACIPQKLLEDYRQGRVVPTSNVFKAGFHPEHLQLMERLQIKANLVVPILNQGNLFGLLVAHHCATTHQWQETEINLMGQLAAQLGLNLERLRFLREREGEVQRSGQLKDITLQLAQTLDRQTVLEIAVCKSRQTLGSERALVYCFDETWKGTVIVESVAEGWSKALGAEIADPCFAENYVEKYQQGRVQAIADIYEAGLTDCHLKQLEPFAVKASLVAPILVEGKLLGLLIAHQCSAPRHWEQPEIDFFVQVAAQVGLAIERMNLLQEKIAEKEQLQRRAFALLMEVAPLNKGDLTIRATVTKDEIGTIADSYNATIENLRQIVTQVQSVTQQLLTTTNHNETEVQSLASEALRQVSDLSLALERVDTMIASIEAVTTNAQQALLAVQQANVTVAEGETAMNQTVDGMMAIRETVAETSKKIQHLGESSQKISKVVNLIGRFAAQTHLLALKASIEAARAGEEGRGFAVIADEVRALAAQSAEATAEIETLVASIQSETKEVAETMAMGTKQVVIGSQLVDETRKSLHQITNVSTQINELIKSIAQSALEQSQTSTSVTRVMTEVAAIAEHNSTSATQVSASFKKLLTVAHQLQENVGQFKV